MLQRNVTRCNFSPPIYVNYVFIDPVKPPRQLRIGWPGVFGIGLVFFASATRGWG